jgi:GNAT superfamily N-acetyltransferase
MSDVEIVRVGAESVDRFEPLWLALRAHHESLEPHIEMIEPARSWELRREVEIGFLDHPDAFALIAVRDGRDIGYAVVTIHPGPDDTWVTGDRIAEVETLSVLPEARGAGVGTRLLDRVDVELDSAGIHDLQIAVVAVNDDARRFYERRGLRPRIVLLSRLTGERAERSPRVEP